MAEPTELLSFVRRHALTIAGVAAGVVLVGYAIYFDHKRRRAPGYKAKIRQMRREAASDNSSRSAAGAGFAGGRGGDIQTLFVNEAHFGQRFIQAGEHEQGAFHIANAAALLDDPREFLSVVRRTVPDEAFNLVIQMLPGARQRAETLLVAMQMQGNALLAVPVHDANQGLVDEVVGL